MIHIIEYKECQGCNTYEKLESGCNAISELYKYCPCQKCLIKIVCDTGCDIYGKYRSKAFKIIRNRLSTGLNCG